MAIGDAVSVFLGTATTNRQPASGVEEQISAITKNGSTDIVYLYDGAVSFDLLAAAINTHTSLVQTWNNTAIMITNTVYLRKDGTTDRVHISGVQTNV